MESLLDNISDLKSELKRKEQTLKEVVKQIKEEISDKYYSYYLDYCRSFHHALFLIFGTYYDKYSEDVSRHLHIKQSKNWDTKKYQNYYNIYKYDYFDRFGCGKDSQIVGFVCFKKDIYNAIENKIYDIWKFYVTKLDFKEGLEDLKTSLKNNPQMAFYAFEKYVENTKGSLFTVHQSYLKIKNVVVYINY